MSARYTNDGKRRSSQTHARHTHRCSCGKTVSGNGGRSSHRRACPSGRWLTTSEAYAARVAEWEADEAARAAAADRIKDAFAAAIEGMAAGERAAILRAIETTPSRIETAGGTYVSLAFLRSILAPERDR